MRWLNKLTNVINSLIGTAPQPALASVPVSNAVYSTTSTERTSRIFVPESTYPTNGRNGNGHSKLGERTKYVKDLTALNINQRRSFTSDILDRYFDSGKTSAEFLRSPESVEWTDKEKRGGTGEKFYIKQGVLEDLFRPKRLEEYQGFSEGDQKDTAEYVRFCYDSDSRKGMSREEKIRDLSEKVVVPYGDRNAFLSERTIRYILNNSK